MCLLATVQSLRPHAFGVVAKGLVAQGFELALAVFFGNPGLLADLVCGNVMQQRRLGVEFSKPPSFLPQSLALCSKESAVVFPQAV